MLGSVKKAIFSNNHNNNNEKIMVETAKNSEAELDFVVAEVRSEFLELALKKPDDFDPIDIEKIKNEEWAIRRFVLENKGKKKSSLKQLIEAMKWRKSMGMNKLSMNDLPVEPFEFGHLSIYETDKFGRPVVYFRMVANHPFPRTEAGLKLALKNGALLIEMVDRIACEKGHLAVIDFSESELKWPSVDEIKFGFLNRQFFNYYPGSTKALLFVNMPWYLKSLVQLAKTILGSKHSSLIQVVNGDQIFDFIDKENVPKCLGGVCDKDFSQPPAGCTRGAEEIARENGLSEKEVQFFLQQLDNIKKKLEKMNANEKSAIEKSTEITEEAQELALNSNDPTIEELLKEVDRMALDKTIEIEDGNEELD